MVDRVAVLADVHCVLPALAAVLAEPDVRSADLIVYQEMWRIDEWFEHYLRNNASDVEALEEFSGRSREPANRA